MGRLSSGLLALIAAATVASAASAADLPLPARAPAYAPPPPARYDWSGIYIGGNVGVGLAQDVVTDTTTTALQPAGTQTRLSPFSVIGGAQAGINYEFNPVVIGAEATWTSSAISGTQVTGSPLIAGTSQQSIDNPLWYATATGRLGFAANDLLFYAKGGAAWMHVNYTQGVIAAGNVIVQQLIGDNRQGYTIGGGIEYAFNEYLSFRVEYDYLNFGTKNYAFGNLTAGGAALVLPVAIQSQTNMLTAGVNYRFNWNGAFAKY